MKLHPLIITGLAAIATILCAAPASAKPAPKSLSTARGVYTEAQAAEGATLYTSACAICHGANLMGTFEVPTLVGRFVHNWSNGSVGTLFDYVNRAMPQMAPGSLSPADDAKIVAYLLKVNGMPAGDKPLSSDQAALDKIAFVPVKPAAR
jgi:S-disulfanyl-L-cysteine oxidoreductase SoxD